LRKCQTQHNMQITMNKVKEDGLRGKGPVMVKVDEEQVRGHLDLMVKTTVEQALNGLLEL